MPISQGASFSLHVLTGKDTLDAQDAALLAEALASLPTTGLVYAANKARAAMPALERVMTDDGSYRVLGRGTGMGAVTFDPVAEALTTAGMDSPLANYELASAEAALALREGGEDNLWAYLEEAHRRYVAGQGSVTSRPNVTEGGPDHA